MKRILVLICTMLLLFSICSCSAGTSTTDSQMASDPGISDESPVEDPVIDLRVGQWYGYETLSWEQVSGLTITVIDVTSTDIVFHYYSPAVSAANVTVTPDADGNATVTLDNDVTLEIHFSPNGIHVDELQGMDAMSYAFK